MSFPTVPTVAANTLLATTTTTASSTHTFPNLTTLAPATGDLIIAVCVQYQGGTAGAEFPATWGATFPLTETADRANANTTDMAIGVAHRIATGTESAAFSITTAHAFRSVNFLMRIPAGTWDGSTIPEVSAMDVSAGGTADPASFDPANWGAEDTLWIAVCGDGETSTTGSPPTIDTPPTNYTGDLIVARAGDAVGHVTAGVAFQQINASAEDAGTWTISNANRGRSAALVIAVRPAAAPIDGPATLDGAGTLSATATVLVLGAATLTGAGTLAADATTFGTGIQGRTATVAENASATTVTGTLPTDRQTGDYVIAHFAMTCSVAQFGGPGGSWTQIVAPTANAASETIALYGMFDPPSAPVGSSSAAANRQTCIMQAYAGVHTTTPVDVTAVTTAGALPLTLTQVTTATDGAKLLSGTCGDFSTGTWTFPAGMTAVANHTSGVGRGAGYADETRTTAGATGTRQWTASTLQTAVGYLVALRPAGGVSTIDGTATLTGAGTVTAAGTVLVPGAATLTGAGTLTATAGGTQTGTATPTGVGVLTAAATVTVPGAAAPAGAGTLSAAATVRVPGTAPLTGAGALTAAAVVRVPGTATLVGAGVLSAVSGAAQFGTATLTGVGTLTATATVQAQGTATLTGAGQLAATPTLRINGTATLAATGTLTGNVIIGTTAALVGVGALAAEGTSAEPYVPAYVGVDSVSSAGTLDNTARQPAEYAGTTTATNID